MHLNLKPNVGPLDKLFRIIVSVFLIGLAATRAVTGWPAGILATLGIINLVEALLNY